MASGGKSAPVDNTMAGGAGDAPPSYSQPPTQSAPASGSNPPVFRTKFGCITLNMSDKIRFINFPPEDVQAMRAAVPAAWPAGIQDERRYGRSQELKLWGNPWSNKINGDDDSRKLLLRMLEVLYDRGWVMQASVDLSKKELDKDSLVFRHQDPAPAKCDWLIISFDTFSKLKIIGTLEAAMEKALVQAFGSAVSGHEYGPGRIKIKFHGSPWAPSGENTVNTRLMLLNILQTLETFGYTVYSSIDCVSAKDGRETDVLVFHRQQGWTRGDPIWHR